ncbi:FAD-dependent oxidoreductase [Natrarchaeobius halalkaliphilus]|uniref:FAD-dependent oxidoreductase n=1 Tax=Natrarchaeobius halalkaliphilus TaxID=1679091 RepID=A0A3N6M2J2_9EURY|nr:FAD-dependent oxidoreductase [Natrarchaeobius halalkaliphilus]RQG90030.1 FAD-dependent oxidoreductase [Natrarchaeobius halalkaliphilus]
MEGTPVTVESVADVGPDTIAIELETPEEFAAAPGQFVLLRAAPTGEEISRHYTLSSPSVTDSFEITVGIDPDGDLSPWLADLDGGETVHLEGPFGTITYERDEDVVAVAGGPGVGPAISIAEAAREASHAAVVIYQDDEPAHLDRLEALADDGASVLVLEEDADGDLADALEAHLEEGRLYAFGFDDFVTFVADVIDGAGGDADDALIENFG